MASETSSSSSSDSKKRRIMIITADETIIEQIQKNSNTTLFKSIVLDSNGDNMELANSHIKDILPEVQSLNNKKTKTGTLTCVVCGSPANGYNFDAISCESCKAFFRRNALKDPTTLECRRNDNCDITLETRRRCSACRLIKCLNKGMRRDRLLTVEQKAAKRRKIEENRTLTLKTNENSQNLTSEINQEKSPLLSSPIIDHSPISQGTNLLLLNDYTDLLPKTTLHESRSLLSAEELQRVETIQFSFEQRIEL
ncbi:unnamed protein product, partial [Rotaria sp. Silwood2]